MIQMQIRIGTVSYYNHGFTGRKTASGEIYDPEKRTCASNFYSFGTYLEIYYPKRDTHTPCRVNDRGPMVKGRILDISEICARDLGMLKDGIGSVLEAYYYTPKYQ